MTDTGLVPPPLPLPPRVPLLLRTGQLDPATAESLLEAEVKERLSAHRRALTGEATSWDETLAFLLMPALAAYEYVSLCSAHARPRSRECM